MRVLSKVLTILAVTLGGTSLLAFPTALSAGGICEEFCAACAEFPEVGCKPLDGCQKSLNKCYYDPHGEECDECG